MDNTSSQYISTTYDINSAMDLGNDYFGKNGYVYKIEIEDSKGVDVNKVLGVDSPYPWEKGFAVVNQISNNNKKDIPMLKILQILIILNGIVINAHLII